MLGKDQENFLGQSGLQLDLSCSSSQLHGLEAVVVTILRKCGKGNLKIHLGQDLKKETCPYSPPKIILYVHWIC